MSRPHGVSVYRLNHKKKTVLAFKRVLRKCGKEQSYVDLVRMLGVVEGTVGKRVKNLQDRKIIKIIAVPNPRELGYNFISIMGLQVRMANFRKVADDLAQKPNVCYLAFVTGRYDLMAIIMPRLAEELSHFITERVSTQTERCHHDAGSGPRDPRPGILRTTIYAPLPNGGSPETDLPGSAAAHSAVR